MVHVPRAFAQTLPPAWTIDDRMISRVDVSLPEMQMFCPHRMLSNCWRLSIVVNHLNATVACNVRWDAWRSTEGWASRRCMIAVSSTLAGAQCLETLPFTVRRGNRQRRLPPAAPAGLQRQVCASRCDSRRPHRAANFRRAAVRELPRGAERSRESKFPGSWHATNETEKLR